MLIIQHSQLSVTTMLLPAHIQLTCAAIRAVEGVELTCAAIRAVEGVELTCTAIRAVEGVAACWVKLSWFLKVVMLKISKMELMRRLLLRLNSAIVDHKSYAASSSRTDVRSHPGS